MIKIEFPADRPDLARIMGEALILVAEASPAAERKAIEEAEAPKSMAAAFTAEPEEADTIGTAPTAAPESTDPSPSTAPVDTKGVAFDANFCGQAKDPYYATGKRSGQWKKRKGVEDVDYDAWYESRLQPGAAQAAIDSAAAFTSAPAPAEPECSAPTTAGEFMGWVSELQAAGRITQEHVNQAYATCGLGINALFPPNTEEQISNNIAQLYGALSHVAG